MDLAQRFVTMTSRLRTWRTRMRAWPSFLAPWPSIGFPPGRSVSFPFVASLGFAWALVLGAGCQPAAPSADIVIINGGEPESLDPAIVTVQSDLRLVRGLFEGVVRLNARTAEPEPGLASSWTISPDGRIYTFHLRTNLLWSTGAPITAEDVVYSWRRVLDPRTAADYAGQLYFVRNGREFNTGRITNSAEVGVAAVDRYAVRVELVAPTPFFLALCTFPTLAIVPRQAIEQHGDRWILSQPLPVSGPYLLDRWRLQDRVRLRKNPNYWDAAATRTEVVDFLCMDSANTALNLYVSGKADILWDKTLVPSEVLDVLRSRPDCHQFSYLGTFFLRINVTRPPLTNALVRRALALAVDRQRIVERITRGGEQPARHFTPRGIPGYEPPDGLTFDPGAARTALAQAGFPGGRGFPPLQYLLTNPRVEQQIAVELQAMWHEVLGVSIELRQNEMKVYQSAQTSLDYDVSRSSWIGDYNDPNTFLELFTSGNGNNRTGWKNARYDRLMAEANALLDRPRRAALLREAETLLVEQEIPIIPVYFYAGMNFFDGTRIDGVYTNLVDEHPIQAIGRREPAPGRR
jgi:oligopeptide transport system substrate-binding protein